MASWGRRGAVSECADADAKTIESHNSAGGCPALSIVSALREPEHRPESRRAPDRAVTLPDCLPRHVSSELRRRPDPPCIRMHNADRLQRSRLPGVGRRGRLLIDSATLFRRHDPISRGRPRVDAYNHGICRGGPSAPRFRFRVGRPLRPDDCCRATCSALQGARRPRRDILPRGKLIDDATGRPSNGRTFGRRCSWTRPGQKSLVAS